MGASGLNLGQIYGRSTTRWHRERAAGDDVTLDYNAHIRGVTAQALGRSRGGYGTKACAVCDARGRPLGFALIPGQASELRVAPDLLLLAALLGTIRRVICDAAYSSVAWFALVMEAGALPVVRANPTHPRHRHFDRAAYRRRHRVENLWARLKEWRAIATRYDKTAASLVPSRRWWNWMVA